MTRPRKQTVDWFPHSCNHGQTMFILERRWGIAGYGFWFKLLEILGRTAGHFIDAENKAKMDYLQAYTYTDRETCLEMLNQLADLEAIDLNLWKQKIIWSDNFVVGVAPCYRNRNSAIPVRPDNYRRKSGSSGINDTETRRGREGEEVEEGNTPPVISSSEDITTPPLGGASSPSNEPPKKPKPKKADRVLPPYSTEFEQFYQHYPNKKGGKEEAWAIWGRRLKKGTLPPINYLMECIYKLSNDADWMEYAPNITTFLNKGRWTDVDALKKSGEKGPAYQTDPNCPYCQGRGLEPAEKDGVKGMTECRCRRKGATP